MGMSVVGLKPTTQEGECFRNNVWSWAPLADYCMKVAPDIAVQCEYWQSNDGGGLDERNSVALAEVLQKEIDSGRCESYARIRESELEPLLNEPCDWCGGTGIRKPPPEHCSYPFVANVQKFVIFLRGCGGFQIW
jgi:hypothetical protein